MSKLLTIFLTVCLVLIMKAGISFAQSEDEKIVTRLSSPGKFEIVRHPPASDYSRDKLSSLPSYDQNSENGWQVDIRSRDLSSLNLKDRLPDLLHADFDSKTVWPSQLPPNFNYNRIRELGKNPGLGLRSLHAKGVTGKNVGIAIIDQPLLVDHAEYKDRLKLYEEINIDSTWSAAMHGPAVASIAVGKTVGVAPGADLYYIADWPGIPAEAQKFRYDFKYYAKAIDRITEINKQLPSDKKIRVISISLGWESGQDGYQVITEAVKKAEADGIFVLYTSIESDHGFKFQGLGRSTLKDPNNFKSYEPGVWWAKKYNDWIKSNNRLLVPMDSRTTASPCGNSDYAFYREGGWSWVIPYIAGVYALAAQVDPKITPEKFWDLALRTGKTIKLKRDGQVMDFGPIINPAGLIDLLKKK